MDTIFDWGVQLDIAIQNLGGWLEPGMQAFSFLGTEYFFMALIPILYWCVDNRLGVKVGFILMVSSGINEALKLAFHWPRPYWYSASVKSLSEETSFGIPSGHAQSAASVWGTLAAGMRTWWAWSIAGLLIFLIGFSRLYLGMHFPHDVLAGWLAGGLLAWLTAHYWERVAARVKRLRLGQQVLTAFLAVLGLILLQAIPYFWLKWTGWQPPTSWAQFAGEAVTMKGAFTTAGTLFGLLAGLAWLASQGGFETSGSWWQLLLRFGLGMAGVLAFYVGLDMLFETIAPEAEALLPFLLRFVRYTLVGAWVVAGAPWVFVRIGLAKKAA